MLRRIHSLIQVSPWPARITALLAGLIYYLQARGVMLTQRSSMDEGNYLLKGLLFANGTYQPFQAYGPWTNKMPLAFLIPGWVQESFGVGLRTGRIYALVLGLLMLFGLWLAARRLTRSEWLAAAVVGAAALNPALVRLYSQAYSQGLTACLLAWVFAFTFGESRRTWELVLGGILAGLTIVTRENMLPLIPLLALYLLWQYGWRKAAYAAGGMLLGAGIVHAVYWPDILRNWAKWFPSALTPFLDPWRVPTSGERIGMMNPSWLDRIFVLFEGLRAHTLALLGSLFGWLLWPKKSTWRSTADFRAGIFLSVFLAVQTGAHYLASAGSDYCTHCFSGYLSFFSLSGLLLSALLIRSWRVQSGKLAGWLSAGAALILSTGLGFSAFADLSYRNVWMQEQAKSLANIQVPRFSGGRILPGSTELWTLFANKFNLTYEQVMIDVFPRLLPTLMGALAGLLILLAGWAVWAALRQRKKNWSYAAVLCTGMLGLAALLTPTRLLGGGTNPYDCKDNSVNRIEAAGYQLSRLISPGSTVDWRGGTSPAVLLYLPGIHIFPPQLNDTYSFRTGGDADHLFRYGYWNEELSTRWLKEADFLLAEANYITPQLMEQIQAAGYREVIAPLLLSTCGGKSELQVFGK